MKKQLRICTILLILNVAMLVILLGGFNLLRIFETTLIRQTEISLNTQAVFIAAIYRDAYAEAIGESNINPIRVKEDEVIWEPIESKIDLASNAMLGEAPKPQAYQGTIASAEALAGKRIVRILQEAQIQTLASIRVVNPEGVVISSTNLLNQISLANRPEVMKALTGEHQSLLRERTLTQPDPGAFSISRRSAFRVHVAHPVKYKNKVIAAVVLARTPESITQLLERYLAEILLYLAIITTLVWLLAAFTSYAIRKPIEAVVDQAKRAAKGEKGAVTPLENPVTYEVAELSNSVAKMAQALEQRADYILEFSSHLSHQFKTPVTSIQGAVELLLDHGESMTPEESQRFLNNLNQDAQYLEKLVLRLLEFAKADLHKTNLVTYDIQKYIKTLDSQYANCDAKVKSTIQKDISLDAYIDEESLDTILRNLIDNAIQAKAENIEIRTEKRDNDILISIMDDGIAISEANKAKIFSPFFTLNKQNGGTGLGLSIVNSLLKSYEGSLELICSGNMKTFTVKLKPV